MAAAVAAVSTIEMQELLAKSTADAAFYAILTTAQQAIDKELLASGLDGPGGGPGPGQGGHH